jgi:hypothetical protein
MAGRTFWPETGTPTPRPRRILCRSAWNRGSRCPYNVQATMPQSPAWPTSMCSILPGGAAGAAVWAAGERRRKVRVLRRTSFSSDRLWLGHTMALSEGDRKNDDHLLEHSGPAKPARDGARPKGSSDGGGTDVKYRPGSPRVHTADAVPMRVPMRRPSGAKRHEYQEEVFIISGRLYDAAFDKWLEPGCYVSRPPGEVHGPFHTDVGCVVLEVSFPHTRGKWRGARDARGRCPFS